MIGSAYLSAEGFEAALIEELTRRGVVARRWIDAGATKYINF
jgi:hypothetical protein